jgi:hypothetical protein
LRSFTLFFAYKKEGEKALEKFAFRNLMTLQATVRQIKDKALQRLHDTSRNKKLKSYLG